MKRIRRSALVVKVIEQLSKRIVMLKKDLRKQLLNALVVACFLAPFASESFAQDRIQPRADMSPGSAGRATMALRRNVFGYVQPTEILVPETTRVAYFSGKEFSESVKGSKKLGLRIGDVYRFKVTNIKGFEGMELYPSVEVIDRLHPAADKYVDYAVPVRLTQSDLEKALNGKLVTKVIYLEDPRLALAVNEIKNEQRTLQVGVGEDPLVAARGIGRPMAILRIGSRTPDANDISLFGSPLVTDYETLEVKPTGDGCRWSPDGRPWPEDEYVFDGGDKNIKAEIGADFTVKGVDLEDTIVHFDTVDGERKVKESNRVPIYSPRFAAIQKVYGLILSHQNESFMGVSNDQSAKKREFVDVVGKSTQQLQPLGTIRAMAASTFRDQVKGLGADNFVSPRTLISNLKLYEDFQIVKLGHMKATESLRMDIGLQAAQEWDHYTAVQAVVENKQTNVAERIQSAQELKTYKPQPGSSKVRIIKLASKSDAKPGEEVEFTIRFDNIGTKTVGNVTIIDNLTPRLALVKGTSECELKHDFLTTVNEKNSLLLRWEIVDPLAPGKGGVIRFKCRVR